MQISSQIPLSVPSNSDVDVQLREFSHRLAKTHSVGIDTIPAWKIFNSKKSDLLEHLKTWEQEWTAAEAELKRINLLNDIAEGHA